MTRAAPKVANYPFTTLEPVLGTLDGEDRQLVLADIPGLIEGAAGGAGLGHDFLAHVERTRLLVHVLDLAPLDGVRPGGQLRDDRARARRATTSAWRALPRILALSKADLVSPRRPRSPPRCGASASPPRPAREEWEEPAPATPVLVTSSATGLGLDELRAELLRRVPVGRRRRRRPAWTADEALEEHRVVPPGAQAPRATSRSSRSRGRVAGRGRRVDRLIARHDLENVDALAHVERRLHRMGVIRALEAHGFEPGDDVEIGGIVFELDPS